ncbi:hypothetical protein F5X97DRAFT_299420 [Nemania serpens]|nr:hypothetical protein F5X97DRAFT_299420 [Nemania serpens]
MPPGFKRIQHRGTNDARKVQARVVWPRTCGLGTQQEGMKNGHVKLRLSHTLHLSYFNFALSAIRHALSSIISRPSSSTIAIIMEPVVRIWLATLKEGHSVVETAFSGVWSQIMTITATYITEGSGHYTLFQCVEQPDLLAVVLGYNSKDLSEKVAMALNDSVSNALDFVNPTELLVMDINIVDLPLDSEKIAILVSESEPAHLDSLPGRGLWAVSEPMILPDVEVDPDAPRIRKWVHIAPSKEADQLSELGTVRNFTPIMESHMDSQPAE